MAIFDSVQRAVFLDRDGTVIVDKHYLCDPAKVELESGAASGLARLAAMGLRLIGITNQSGVAKGMFDLAMVDRVNDRVAQLLAAYSVAIEHWYVCPHDNDDGCVCRKPAPGMMLMAARERGINLAGSFVIGDKLSDVALGAATGACAILVKTGKGSALTAAAHAQGYSVARDLDEAAAMVAAMLTQGEERDA